ncbi:MAG: GNAT family N-acetyltransferase [Alphaproteobacteria bacterium]|nr:GNAT family N-acetyltransferase [Alphaproteobacteria bacterium]
MTTSGSQRAEARPLYAAVEIVNDLPPADLYDLCDAADAAIDAGGGFGWVTPPAREVLEKYWRGVMVVPERHLLIARVDGVVCGAVQLVEPNRNNEAQAAIAQILAHFVAPWARGQGAGRKLMETAEKLAAEMGYKVLHLDVRATQTAAVSLYEKLGYKRWGTNPTYAMVDGHFISGHFYGKTIRPLFVPKKVQP